MGIIWDGIGQALTCLKESPVHLRAVYHTVQGFQINFRHFNNAVNNSMQFTSRGPPTVPTRQVSLNSRLNTVWGQEKIIPYDPYPFVVNTTTSVHILVTVSGFVIFIDQSFCCFFDHVLPYEKVKYLFVPGYIRIEELRV
ncbi:galectin-7 [Biomphalaria glabrata]|nr:galectin-7-like [Biomphalaria glabrata]